MKLYSRSNNRGIMLITTLLVTVVLTMISLPYIARIATDYKLTSKFYNSTVALNLAEAGVERAIWCNNNGSFSGWSQSTDGDGNTVYSISVNAFKTVDNVTMGDYTVTAVISNNGMTAAITSASYVPNRTSADETKAINVTYTKNNFGRAITSLGNISLSGAPVVDSYDSSLGPYNKKTATSHGDIACNGSITLSGSPNVYGSANPGPGHPFPTTGWPYSQIQKFVSGTYGTLQSPLVVDPIPASAIDAARASNNNANIVHDENWSPLSGYALTVDGSHTITLPSGTYYFTSISVINSGQVNIGGPVIIYVDAGNISLGGAGMVNPGQPRNLQIYSTGSSITDSNSADLVAAVYAPNATVSITGSADFYGSLTCGSETLANSGQIHFDTNLLNVSPVFSSSRAYSWKES